MQAVIVEKDQAPSGAKLRFDAEKISATNTEPAMLKAAGAQVNTLEITAQNAVAAARTVIALREGGSALFGALDSRKLLAEVSDIPDAYTLKPSADRQAIPTGVNILGEITEGTIIPICLSTIYEGEVALTFTGMDAFDAEITLCDAFGAQRETDLTGRDWYEYRFHNNPATADNRFFVRIASAPSGIADSPASALLVYCNRPNTLQIVSGSLLNQLTVSDMQGQTLYSNPRLNAYEHTIEGLPKGMYVVTAQTAANRKITKALVW
jgi:hypothetical protein